MSETPHEPTSPARRRDDARMHTAEMAALPAYLFEDDVLGSGPVAPPLPRARVAALVAAGGALGAVLRWVLTLIEPTTTTATLMEVPWATFGANLLGSLGLGVLAGCLEVRPARQRWLQPLLGPGFFGGFTTMSTLVLEGSVMMGAGFPYLAGLYALGTLVLCLLGCVAGIAAGHRIGQGLETSDRVRSRVDVPVTTGETVVVDISYEEAVEAGLIEEPSTEAAGPDGDIVLGSHEDEEEQR